MGFLMPKSPTIAPPPPPPPPAPIRPQDAVFLREDKLKRQLMDPQRVGRMETIKTGPRGVMDEAEVETGRSLLRGKRNAKAGN